jgi:hypothetical protein
MARTKAGWGSGLGGFSDAAAKQGEARMRTIDQNHIHQELVRLSKLARDLRMKELAHFIDVAGEVASEMTAQADRSKETRH